MIFSPAREKIFRAILHRRAAEARRKQEKEFSSAQICVIRVICGCSSPLRLRVSAVAFEFGN